MGTGPAEFKHTASNKHQTTQTSESRSGCNSEKPESSCLAEISQLQSIAGRSIAAV